MRTRWIEITQRAEYCCCSRFWIPKTQIKIIRVHVFHQINSNVHDNKNINNNDNTNCFTAITRSEKDCLHVIVCVYVCVWVCVTLRKNVFLQISIFLVGGAFAGFFLKKREQSPRPRTTNTQPKKTEREFTLPHDPRSFLIPRFTFVACAMTFKRARVYTQTEREENAKTSKFFQTLFLVRLLLVSRYSFVRLFFSIPKKTRRFSFVAGFAVHSQSQSIPNRLDALGFSLSLRYAKPFERVSSI